MKIIGIRHLPTSWNKKGKLQGRRNIDIIPPNQSQVIQIKKNIRRFFLSYNRTRDIILCSELIRTQSTAQAYGIYDYQLEPLLNEFDFGWLEGTNKENIDSRLDGNWINNPKEVNLGEHIQNLQERITKFVELYYKYEQVYIFGHGAWLRAFVAIFKYQDLNMMNKIQVNNGDIVEIEIESISS